MSTLGKRVIYVGPADVSDSKPLTVEGVATEASILPGSLLDYAAAGAGLELMDDAGTVFGNSLLIADKDQMRSKSVDTAWTINENMVAISPRVGEFFNALTVSSQDLEVGTAMTSSASVPGALLIAATDGSVEILCYSDEDVTTTDKALVRMKR